MEEFRPLIVDAVVLSLINKRSLTLADFTTEPLSGAVSFNHRRTAYISSRLPTKETIEFQNIQSWETNAPTKKPLKFKQDC